TARESGLELLTHADKAQVQSFVVIDPSVLAFAENQTSNLEISESVIQVDSALTRGNLSASLALDRSVANLHKLSGVEPTVYFMSEDKINDQVTSIYRSVRFSEKPWASLRSLEVSSPKLGDSARLPVVGRHSTYSKTPWPELLSDIKLTYVQPDIAQTRICEDLSVLSQKAQKVITNNSEVLTGSSMKLTDYLDSLDFWVMQNSERMVTTVPAGVIDAMCRGLVVILPPEFEPIFGSAALYSKPKNVAALIKRV